MVSVSPVYGYAPEALVSSIAGAVLTLNTTTFGAHGFADTYQDDGVTLRTDGGANTFTPGDKVQLVELDATSPATPFDGEVLSTSGATVTLTASTTTTTVEKAEIPPGGQPFLSARTANASAEIGNGTMSIAESTKGQFIITHANNGQIDRTFGWVVFKAG